MATGQSDDELKNLVDEFLYLVEVGSGSSVADESELEHLLDRLALAMRHIVVLDEPEDPPEIPARNVDILEKVAASRFPRFGTYLRPADLTAGLEQGRLEAVPPARDVAEIADHLHAVAWLWRNATWSLGLWYLEESHRKHWGTAMRALQLYLHVRAASRNREAAE